MSLSPFGRIQDCEPHYQHLLADLVRQHKPDIAVETGFLFGLGAEYLLKAMDDNDWGRLFSIDPNPYPVGPEHPVVEPLAHPRLRLIREKSSEALLPLYELVGPFDLFVHDSDHGYECQSFEYDAAWLMVRSGGIIASDDIWTYGENGVPHRAWEKFCKSHGLTWTVIGNAAYVIKP